MLRKVALFILIFAIALYFSACGNGNEAISTRPVLSGLEFVKSIEKIDIHMVTRQVIEDEYLEKARAEFKRLFDMDINLVNQLAIDIAGLKTAQTIRESGSSGMYLFSYASIERISELSENSEILPLDEYLLENDTWNALPEGMRKMYEFSDGKTWAIPRGYTPVVNGRVFRKDYLDTLGLEVPVDLDSLYEVSLKIAASDPDGNGKNDTYGLAYADAFGFQDIFYANGVPVNRSNDGYHFTSIAYNPLYGSFEDSMLMGEMEPTLEYIDRLRKEGIASQLGGRSSSGNLSILYNDRIANIYTRVTDEIFADERFAINDGIAGMQSEFLNPLTYDFSDGFYVMGASTRDPAQTINYFVSLFFGDLQGYLLASRGLPGDLYEIGSGDVMVLDYDFFGRNQTALIGSNPLFSYETMDIAFNAELAGTGVLETIIEADGKREAFVQKAREAGVMYELSVMKAYPEVFKVSGGEIINSAAGTVFDNQLNRILSGRVSIKDSIETYIRDMKTLGMQDILNDLNNRIGEKTKFKY
ncbi:MAG: hypothetical protein JXB33_03620 [Clostridia bacterium]|nr:hypothetical protein [Clostridia bacterium]